MKISELEEQLRQAREEHGDIDVVITVEDIFDVSAWSIEEVFAQIRAPISRLKRDGGGLEHWIDGYSEIAGTCHVLTVSAEKSK